MDDEVRHRCEICGEPARVRVLDRYANGEPVFRQYCLDCADRDDPIGGPGSGPSSRHHLTFASLMIVAGLSISLLGALGDYVGVHSGVGIGWYQTIGIAVGALFVLIGALLGADVIAVFGTIVFGLAACADLMGFGGVAGIGWKQNLAIFAGVVLTFVGVLLRLRLGRRS
ncbi:MAG: hypothetical protein JXQ73_20885 [Phycisphaerae bacterium]|nr:hypothetical protein [Phycisphaerae bacterium]